MLNEFYATRVTATRDMAFHILSIPDIDQRLQKGDISLVDEIKPLDTDHCSFASKFCSFHNPSKYPIHDSFVAKVITYYSKKDSFIAQDNYNGVVIMHAWDQARRANKKYNNSYEEAVRESYEKIFYPVIDEFRTFYGLDDYTFKQLDRFLWQLGKEYFVDYSITDINRRYIIILKQTKIYLYELCIELNKGKTQQNGVRGKEYVGVATEEDFDSVRNLLEKHCNYVTKKDGIVGEFYIEVKNDDDDETKGTAKDEIIKVFHKKCLYDIKDGRNKKVIKDILDTLDTLANSGEISEETFERVCKEKMEKHNKNN